MDSRFSTTTGFVDGVSHGDVIGWAVDFSEPQIPVIVDIHVNGLWATSTAAMYHRADVAEHLGSSGLHGLCAAIPSRAYKGPIEVSVVTRGGIPLENSPLRVDPSLLCPPPERLHSRRLLFMHIQKTAGTAFRDAIIRNYRASDVLLFYPDAPGIWKEAFQTIPPEIRSRFKCAIGHFMFGFHEQIDAPAEYVTVLRDPVARTISQYWHMIRNEDPLVRSGDKIAKLEDVLEMQVSSELDNLMTRFLCGQDGERYPAGSVNQDSYDLARQNLRHFSFIGHQEDSAAAWDRLRRIFGWRLGELGVVNVGNAPRGDVSKTVRQAIEHYCKYDLMLYKDVLQGDLVGRDSAAAVSFER